MKKLIIPAMVAAALAGCSEPTVQASETVAPVAPVPVPVQAPPPVPAEPPKPVFAWSYDEKTDQMRGTTERFATLYSSDVVRTNWPYDQSPMRLTIRRRATDGVNVMFSINGQFLCNEYSGSTHITVKFDGGPLERFQCVEGASGGNDTIFIEPESRFISRVKASKIMMVEAAVYEIGRTQVSFKVEGLDWG